MFCYTIFRYIFGNKLTTTITTNTNTTTTNTTTTTTNTTTTTTTIALHSSVQKGERAGVGDKDYSPTLSSRVLTQSPQTEPSWRFWKWLDLVNLYINNFLQNLSKWRFIRISCLNESYLIDLYRTTFSLNAITPHRHVHAWTHTNTHLQAHKLIFFILFIYIYIYIQHPTPWLITSFATTSTL